MANAQYWREQVAQLHRAVWASRRHHRRRLREERVPLRLRNDPASTYRHHSAFDSVGNATVTGLAGTPQPRASR
jgi:hypothetical protein